MFVIACTYFGRATSHMPQTHTPAASYLARLLGRQGLRTGYVGIRSSNLSVSIKRCGSNSAVQGIKCVVVARN